MIYYENGNKYILGCKLSKTSLAVFISGFVLCMACYLMADSTRFEVDWNLTESLPKNSLLSIKIRCPKRETTPPLITTWLMG